MTKDSFLSIIAIMDFVVEFVSIFLKVIGTEEREKMTTNYCVLFVVADEGAIL